MAGRLTTEESEEKRWKTHQMWARGMTNKEIATSLGISDRQVRRYIKQQLAATRQERERDYYEDLAKSLASYEAIKADAWERLQHFRSESSATNVVGLLNTISQTQERIDKIKGLMGAKGTPDDPHSIEVDFIGIMKGALDRANKEKK